MKKSLLPLIFLSFSAFSQAKPEEKPQKLLGEIPKESLQKMPYQEWFEREYNAYDVQSQSLKPIKEKLKKIEVKIFLGTWCGDSKREVPRFMKVLDNQGVNYQNIKIICADDLESGAYKQSPNHEEKGLGIHRVPTFLFYENGKEIGRIVESPVVSLEQDLVVILNHNRYIPKYNIANFVLKTIDEGNLKYLEENLLEFADEWKSRLSSSNELNTVGYVLLAQKKFKEAILILKLNAEFYPNVPNVHDSLGEAYSLSGDKEKSIKSYQKVLELKPKHENALKKLRELQ
jgi:tetratricopeptide (TPR) repeat protein